MPPPQEIRGQTLLPKKPAENPQATPISATKTPKTAPQTRISAASTVPSDTFLPITDGATPDEGVVERDAWTMVGYLPQEGEAVGAESVLDIATGRTTVPILEQRLKEMEAKGDVSSDEYNETHIQHDALNDPQVEAKAKKILASLSFRQTDFDRPAKACPAGLGAIGIAGGGVVGRVNPYGER